MGKRQKVYDLYWYFTCESQNIFCELDKYTRKLLPELKSNRVRIKKKYTPKTDKIEYIYPTKWHIENKSETY